MAVALSRIQPSIGANDSVEIDIYEASAKLTQIGAGITLWPRAWKILVEQLGLRSLLDHLADQQVPDDEPRKLRVRLPDRTPLAYVSFSRSCVSV